MPVPRPKASDEIAGSDSLLRRLEEDAATCSSNLEKAELLAYAALERPVGPKAGGELPQKKLSPPESYEAALLAGPAEELQDMSSARIRQNLLQMSRSDLREDVQQIMLHQQHALQETFAVELEKVKSLLQVHQQYLEKVVACTPLQTLANLRGPCLTRHPSGTSVLDKSIPGSEVATPLDTGMSFADVSNSQYGCSENFQDGCDGQELRQMQCQRSQSQSDLEKHEDFVKVFQNFKAPNSKRKKSNNWLHTLANASEPNKRLARVVGGNRFMGVVSFLILCNTVFIGYETNDKVRRVSQNLDSAAPHAFRIINIGFTVVFFLELIVRLYVLRFQFFISDDWKWNIFDLFLVVTSIAQECLESVELGFVRVVRVFRVIRVARIIRVLRFFRELRHMVFIIVQSLGSLSWAFLLLLLITYVFSIFVMSGASEFIESKGPSDANSKELQIYFGDINLAMYSLIHAISGGEDWGPMSNALAEQSELYRMAFVAYIVFVVFGVLNVLTGVFCSTGSEILDKDLLIHQEKTKQRQFVHEMLGIFEELDPDQDGHFTWEEFAQVMQDPNLHAYFNANDLDTSDAELLFQLLDHNNSKEVQTMDFIVGCFKLKGAAKSIQVMKMAQDIERIGRQVAHLVRRISG